MKNKFGNVFLIIISMIVMPIFSGLSAKAVVAAPKQQVPSPNDWAQIRSLLPALPATPPSQQAYIKASNTNASDEFGFSVAMDGDTLVVGAYREDSNATGVGGNQTDNSKTDAGAVYVFTRSAGVWSQQAYIKASNTDAGDYFGYSVAIDGDTLVVGAVYEASNATGVGGNQANNAAGNSGAAYVFTRTAGVWSQQAYIKASNTQGNDLFGRSVAVSGNTLVVGAVLEASNATGVGGNQADNSATNAGAVYVFTRTAGVWSQQAYIKASNTGDSDRFGWSVAMDGDTLVVGAFTESSNATGVGGDQTNNSATQAGAVYVFTRIAGVWSQQAYIKASNTGGGDYFGTSVAVFGDTLVVGASGEASNATGVNGNQADNSASTAGAVYVFTRTAGVWSQQAYIKASNTGTGDYFGNSVAIDGDTLVVGAYGEASNATGVDGNQANNSATDAGAVYLFTRTAGVWSQQAYIKASNTGVEDWFGNSVAISGDTLVVGTHWEDSNAIGVGGDQTNNAAPQAGAVYVFITPPPATATPTATASATATETQTSTPTVTPTVTPTSTQVPVSVTINQAVGQVDPAYADSATATIHFTAVFSEGVAGFTGSDISFSGTTLTGTLVATVTEIAPFDGTTYDVAVTGMLPKGTVFVSIPANAVTSISRPSAVNSASTSTDGQVTFDYVLVEFGSNGTHDGWVLESSETSGLGGSLNSTAQTASVGDDASDKQYRSLVSFATGSLPDNGVIYAVNLRIIQANVVGTNPFSTHGALKAEIKKNFFGTSAALQTSDFNATFNKLACNFGNVPEIIESLGPAYRCVVGGVAIPYINLKGNTQFRLRFTLDDNNDLSADLFKFYSGNFSNGSQRPRLFIKYFIAPAP